MLLSPFSRATALLCLGVALTWASGAGGADQTTGANAPIPGAPRHPYGSHLTRYTSGSILPSVVTRVQLDTATSTFYDAWKRRYLVNGCGEGRSYVFVNADGSATGATGIRTASRCLKATATAW